MKRKIISILVVVGLLVGLLAFPVQAATDEEIEGSIEAGLAWLVAQQDTSGGVNDGSWIGYSSREAGTGLALYKLCDRAYELEYESPFDPAYEYSSNVLAGFTWLFNQLQIADISNQDHTSGASGTMDDPDTRDNDKGVCSAYNSYRETYYTGIFLAAIAASGTPDRLNEGGIDVDGNTVADTYQEIAQDMVDFLAFSQVDPVVGGYSGQIQEGGWDYLHVDNGAGGSSWKGDQSNSGYAVLGLAEAQAFGCTVPDWVKTELSWWVDYVQDDTDFGSWYSYPGDGIGKNILKTGNLILEMTLAGDAPDTARMVNALEYLENNWANAVGWPPNNGWKSSDSTMYASDYQTIFCIMKGLEYAGIDTFGDPAIDWFEEFSDAIVAEQDVVSGGWLLPGSWEGSESVINTEWALLTLEKVAPPTPMIEVSVDIKPTSCPNPLNVDGKGVLPVAILGTADFDVTQVDPASVRLVGVTPLRWSLEDVATPYGDQFSDPPGCMECTTEGADGYMDLTLKFDTQEIVAALGPVNDGDCLLLVLTGNLKEEFGGTPISGADVVRIIKK